MWLVYSSLIAQFYGLINRDFQQFSPDPRIPVNPPRNLSALFIYLFIFNPGGPGKRTSVPNSRGVGRGSVLRWSRGVPARMMDRFFYSRAGSDLYFWFCSTERGGGVGIRD